MSANQGFAGFIYDNSDVLGNANIRYQGFFYKVNGSSSPSIWSGVRLIESSGYYSITLSDGDWLTPDGNATVGDKIIITFWKPSTVSKDSLQITEWGVIEITLTSADTYIQNVQIKTNQIPLIAGFSVPATAEISQVAIATNSSTDNHDWTAHGTLTHQWGMKYGQTINEISNIAFSQFDWGDGHIDSYPGVSNGSHAWATIGDFEVALLVQDYSGEEDTHYATIRITWRSPSCGLSWLPLNPTIQQVAHFTPAIIDADNRVTTVDYIIDSVPTHTGVSKTFQFDKQFSTNENHTVRQILHWNDEFVDKTTEHDFTIIMTNIPPTVTESRTYETIPASKYTFVAVATDIDGTITNYNWQIWHLVGGIPVEMIFTDEGIVLDTIEYMFITNEDTYRVIVTVTDNKGGTGFASHDFTTVIDSGVVNFGNAYIVKLDVQKD